MRLIDADALKRTLKNLKAEGNNRKYVQGLQDAIDGYFPQIIDDAPTADVQSVKHGQWKSVEDELPEKEYLYIVCKTFKGHQISFEARWEGNKWLSVVDNKRLDYITHWQPLPEPPETFIKKEDDKNETFKI